MTSKSATQLFISTDKKSSLYPLPAGAPQGCFAKGQTDTPIIPQYRGEVLCRVAKPYRGIMTARTEKTV
ncbi:MAG TPA: hypothetical protein VMN99_15370, partial [Anaerolineales bacterium]|nr:hypothetical protein [Anaerolineales bacterium]